MKYFFSFDRDKYSGLELAKRAIKMFVAHKSQMNPKHQFAFLVFKEEATMVNFVLCNYLKFCSYPFFDFM